MNETEDLVVEILPGNVVDKDELAVFPCQLVRESHSFGCEVAAIWIHRFQHSLYILGTKLCEDLISGQEKPTGSGCLTRSSEVKGRISMS